MNEWTIPATLIGILIGQIVSVVIEAFRCAAESYKRKNLPPLNNYTSNFRWTPTTPNT